jgi:hypothetical protein
MFGAGELGAVEAGGAAVLLPEAGCAADDAESWLIALRVQAKIMRSNPEPERTMCIRTFWESITLAGK